MSTTETTRHADRSQAGAGFAERIRGGRVSGRDAHDEPPRGFLDRRRFTETKSAWKTTELLVLALTALGIAVAAWQLDNIDAPRAWTLLTALAIGYMVARGIAKAGKGVYDDD